jgi:hypothetical protein
LSVGVFKVWVRPPPMARFRSFLALVWDLNTKFVDAANRFQEDLLLRISAAGCLLRKPRGQIHKYFDLR